MTTTLCFDKLHPISIHVCLAYTDDGRVGLTDGRRFVEYESADAALEDETTKRKLYFGEAL